MIQEQINEWQEKTNQAYRALRETFSWSQRLTEDLLMADGVVAALPDAAKKKVSTITARRAVFEDARDRLLVYQGMRLQTDLQAAIKSEDKEKQAAFSATIEKAKALAAEKSIEWLEM